MNPCACQHGPAKTQDRGTTTRAPDSPLIVAPARAAVKRFVASLRNRERDSYGRDVGAGLVAEEVRRESAPAASRVRRPGPPDSVL